MARRRVLTGEEARCMADLRYEELRAMGLSVAEAAGAVGRSRSRALARSREFRAAVGPERVEALVRSRVAP